MDGVRMKDLDNNERPETDVVQQYQICIKRQSPRAINHQVDNYYLTLTNLWSRALAKEGPELCYEDALVDMDVRMV